MRIRIHHHVPPASPTSPAPFSRRFADRMPTVSEIGPLLALVLACAFFISQSDRFLSFQNLSLILQQTMVVAVIAIGQTLIVLTGGIDLSCGMVMAFGSIVMTKFAVTMGVPPVIAIACGVAASTLFGLLNGTLITKIKLPAFIVTLGTLNIAFALTQVYSNAESVSNLPDAMIYVYDNNSTDRTVEVARAAGATVRTESRQGKGHVVRRMFGDVDADIYVLVDGDATYDAPSVRPMIARLVEGGLDMVVGARRDQEQAAYRFGHRFGNRVLTGFVAQVFGATFEDMLSGYRVFSRRFVKSFPALATGFEIETELTVHALELRLVAGQTTDWAVGPEPDLESARVGRKLLDGADERIVRGANVDDSSR